MLTFGERLVFILAVLATGFSAFRLFDRILRTIRRGHGQIDWSLARKRLFPVIAKVGSLQPTFRLRPWTSLFHAFIAWAFIFYLLVNLGDILEAFLPNFHFLGIGLIGNLYHLGADLLSVAGLLGMTALVIRRFIYRSPALTTRQEVLLQPVARAGIRRDSAIVAGFILVHVGSRFLGSSVSIARLCSANFRAQACGDFWRPFASAVWPLWGSLNPTATDILSHAFFWGATGTILLFIPYFLYSKHLHLFFAPLNFLLKPERSSIGQLDRLDFDDENIEQYGASRLEDLGWEQILDAYACIMCYRCQEVCPAYNTGKVLSPAAMEINKRYLLNIEGKRLADGEASTKLLIDWVIPAEAIWACTACGACVDICPVNNEPMRDILDIRRSLVLMENAFPPQLQTAYRGMERHANPWNVPATERLKWAEGLDVPTIDENPQAELLWWVGCAPATDDRAQKIARAFALILNAAGVNYAVLGQKEQCSGDSARRSGNEFLFSELAMANIEILNEVSPSRIVTTCPHCLHTIRNEYPAFGGEYQVIHHTQLIHELLATGRMRHPPIHVNDRSSTTARSQNGMVAFHDPCYLGRQNNILADPRAIIQIMNLDFHELSRHGKKSFCCGAGGGQMWKEEERGFEAVNQNRLQEAIASGANTLAVGCPFCMVMLTDAAKARGTSIEVLDVAEIVAIGLGLQA